MRLLFFMLSACLIVKNEEACLARCLSSLHAIADEIIVLDTGSSDRSMEIARSFHARVVEWQPDGDFSFAEARNTCQRYAQEDWILCLDADEYLQDAAALRDTLKKLPPSVGGVYLPRRNHFLGKSGAYEIDVRLNLRVFRRHPDILWQGKIHERIVEQVEAAGFETYCAPTLLEHDLLQLDRTTIAQKQQAYLQRILSELDRDPHSAWMAMQAGKTYQFLDDYANAQRYFEAAIQCDDPYARHLAICYLALLSAPGRDPEAGLRLLKTHASEAVQSGLHCFVQGELELLAGRPEAALAAYEKVSIVGDSSVVKRFPADKRFTPAQRAERFGTCYVALGEREKALEYFAQALSEEGVASRSHYALARVYLREGNREKTRVHLESALAISPEWTEVRHVLRALQD